MRQLSAVFIMGALSLLACVPARAIDAAELWRPCAQSELIVEGTVSVPLNKDGRIEAGSDGYTAVFVRVDRTIKGPKQGSVVVRQYVNDRRYDAIKRQLTGFDGQRAVLFLVSASDDGVNRNWYFAGLRTGLALFAPDAAPGVAAEVERQRVVLLNWKPHSRDGDRKAVKVFIDRMVDAKAEEPAFKTLESLGAPYVPAIIDLMDDRRELATKALSLRNYAPDRFEEFRLYGPKLIVDAVAAILNQITHEDFGFIYNGATDAERNRTVAGWRIYQDVLLNHQGWLKAG